MDKTDHDKALLNMPDVELKKNPAGEGIVDVAAQVRSAGQKIGVLRIGFTRNYIVAMIGSMIVLVLFSGAVVLTLGVFAYRLLVERDIIAPLKRVIIVAKKISQDGDMGQEEIEVSGNDEIAQLAT